jgi:hypothetical protein
MLSTTLDFVQTNPTRTIVGLFIGCLLVLWIVPFIYNVLFSPMRKVPGPFWARITKLWEFYAVLRGRSHEDYISLHNKYGE